MSTQKLQLVEKAKGRAMLTWAGKKPLESIEYYPAQEKEIYGDKQSPDFNKLFWGDNLQVLSHLLKEYRGKVDLIYIDPPFDSKADYVRNVQIKGEKVQGEVQGLFEEKQYTDIWEKDEYLQFIYERLLIMKELIQETGSIYLHCDWHKSSYLRLILDEVFGSESFNNEIIWSYSTQGRPEDKYARKHDVIFWYVKNSKKYIFNKTDIKIPYSKEYISSHFRDKDESGKICRIRAESEGGKSRTYYPDEGMIPNDVWNDIYYENPMSNTRTDYPTQKPETLLERIIKGSTNKGDLILDCFCGSGTTMAVAQKLGRKWLGCDINLGAIQTTTKRLNQIIEEQRENDVKDFKGSLGFKILNVNDYSTFKNEIEAKNIVMEMYGIEPIKRSYFDGTLDNALTKLMPMNRVLNRLDIKTLLKNVTEKLPNFVVRKQSKSGETIYNESVLVICSGMELDVLDFLKKENKTGVKIEVRDITTDKKNLIFKQKPEAKIKVSMDGKKLSINIEEFISPILMRKLELENSKVIKKEAQTKVDDFRQIIDSVAIDIDYTGDLFNAEIVDLPTKRELIKTSYNWEYSKKGKNIVAVKIIDVLGEEYFETFQITV